jgi:hypothetical protein
MCCKVRLNQNCFAHTVCHTWCVRCRKTVMPLSVNSPAQFNARKQKYCHGSQTNFSGHFPTHLPIDITECLHVTSQFVPVEKNARSTVPIMLGKRWACTSHCEDLASPSSDAEMMDSSTKEASNLHLVTSLNRPLNTLLYGLPLHILKFNAWGFGVRSGHLQLAFSKANDNNCLHSD